MKKHNAVTEAMKQKALAQAQAGRFVEAASLCDEVLRLDAKDFDAWHMLGALHGKTGRLAEAAACIRKAIALRPEHAEAHLNLGLALRDQGRFPEAIEAFQAAFRLRPENTMAQDCLTHALLAVGRLDDAIKAFREALVTHPRRPELHLNLGYAYKQLNQFERSIECFQEVQRLNPDLPFLYTNLGSSLCFQGRHAEAIACYREGLRRNPSDFRARTNLLLTLNYLPGQDQGEVFQEHRAWGEMHGNVAPRELSFPNDRDPERRLRIGYVSQDLRTHSVAYFFEPVLRMHDRDAVETFCYASVIHPDATTARLRSLSGHWIDITRLTDEQVASRVRADRIDILVDLAGHTGRSRLPIFAHKPAPVQVTYLGYPNTTGLATVDYRLTDALADPEGQEAFYVERLERLPGCFLCYQPPETAPVVAPAPVNAAGYVTFGSFNNQSKINAEVISAWAEILRAVPDARFVVKNISLSDGPTEARLRQMFLEHGVASDRIDLTGRIPADAEHLALYGKIDIALDTFPYTGTTTTCEALWMGVPVVTLTGRAHVGRVGVSILSAAGLDQFIATGPDDYVARAVDLAANPLKLAELRAAMRERVRHSPLCDARRFTGNLETAYREMWRRWCASEGSIPVAASNNASKA
jgi:predicted O-linked N-acetylglucosamine transferase (SPINDLY family)